MRPLRVWPLVAVAPQLIVSGLLIASASADRGAVALMLLAGCLCAVVALRRAGGR